MWQWVTTEIKPVTGDANRVLIELIDRIRMLDIDLIRLNQKVNVILSVREKYDDTKKALDKQNGYRFADTDDSNSDNKG